MSSKRFRALVKDKPAATVTLADAVSFVKSHANAKFDETIELHARLGIDEKKSEQGVRGTVQFPHGAPAAVRVAVFTNDRELQAAATEAGADLVGSTDMIERVKAQGTLTADVAVATPDMMKELATVAKILGPKNLMPNPKTGTIGSDPAAIVRELKRGKVAFKADEGGNVHLAVGKTSWEVERLVANARAALDAIKQAKPVASKGEYLRSVTLTSTMGSGVVVRA